MKKVIGFANQKGGVGKTTTTINSGAELAKKSKVLIMDLDPQGNTSETLCNGQSSFEFDETLAALFDKPKTVNLPDLIRPAMAGDKVIDNLFLAPSDFQLSRVIETSLTKINRERILEKHLNKLGDEYDYILLDTPPNLSLTTLNAIQASDLIVIPVDAGKFSLNGIRPLLEAIEEIKDDEVNYKILRNEVDSRNTLINGFVEQELEAVSERLLKTIVRRSEHVGQANVMCAPVRFYKSGSVVNNDYQSLVKEVAEYFV